MGIQCDNLKDAEDTLERRSQLNTVGFCPLINDLCKSACVCYGKARMTNLTQGGVTIWTIYDGYCDNCMFHEHTFGGN